MCLLREFSDLTELMEEKIFSRYWYTSIESMPILKTQSNRKYKSLYNMLVYDIIEANEIIVGEGK